MKFFSKNNKTSQNNELSEENYNFMVTGRAHGLMALWAAERMGKTSEGAANYADELVDENIDDQAFLKKLAEDLEFHEQHVEDSELTERLEGFKVVAKLEYEDEAKLGGCS